MMVPDVVGHVAQNRGGSCPWLGRLVRTALDRCHDRITRIFGIARHLFLHPYDGRGPVSPKLAAYRCAPDDLFTKVFHA